MRMSVKYNFLHSVEAIFAEKNHEKNYLIRIDRSCQRLAVCQPLHIFNRCQLMGT